MSFVTAIRPQAIEDAQENASWYGECVSARRFYAYVANDPLNLADPRGLCADEQCQNPGSGSILLQKADSSSNLIQRAQWWLPLLLDEPPVIIRPPLERFPVDPARTNEMPEFYG